MAGVRRSLITGACSLRSRLPTSESTLRVQPSGMPAYPLLATSPANDAIPLVACAEGDGFGVLSDAAAGNRPGRDDVYCSIGAVEVEPSLFADDFE